jgi:hypothetical protein
MTRQLLKFAAATAFISACATSLFAPPDLAYAADATPVFKSAFKNGVKSTDWIDFEFYRNSQILVPVKINGHAAVAWLAIGAISEMDVHFAESIGLQPEHIAAPGDGGGAAAETISGVELQVGELTVQGVSTRVKDLSTQATKLGHPYSIFLSDDVLKAMVVDIDFPNHRLALRDPETTVKPAGAQELSLAKVGVGYSVPVSVENAKPALFHLEFGNSSPLMVTRPYALSRKLLEGRHVSQRYTGPTKEPEDMATLNDVAFAGVKFLRMPTVVVPNSLFDPAWFDSDRLSGIVGMPLLARYRLLFDFTHSRLYALANAKAMSQPFDKDRLGATLVNGQVAFVAPNSPAQLVGMKAGDKIALINGKPPAVWSNTETLELKYAPAGTLATFTMSGGEVHQLKLAEYY